jgi:23S rRNA pseudouridine1911/1915/1917 synthase
MSEQSNTSHVEQFRATAEDAGQRLDRYLASQLPQLSRTRVQELIEQGRVRIAGGAAHGEVRASHRMSEGESVQVEVLERPALIAVPEDIPIELLREDDDFVVVNKPAGMIVHAGAGQTSGTLVNALLHRLGSLSETGDTVRPGIVHRLDRGTSGVLVVARNDEAHRAIAEQFEQREVEKYYLALIHGRIAAPSGSITLPISRDLERRTRMTTRRREGREARTDWRVLLRLEGFTLVETRLHTGRTHQIRVHFSSLGQPVVGDTVYGAPRVVRIGGKNTAPLGRTFLHAARIAFSHPQSGERIEVRAPLAPELREYLYRVGAASGTESAKIDAALKGYL